MSEGGNNQAEVNAGGNEDNQIDISKRLEYLKAAKACRDANLQEEDADFALNEDSVRAILNDIENKDWGLNEPMKSKKLSSLSITLTVPNL